MGIPSLIHVIGACTRTSLKDHFSTSLIYLIIGLLVHAAFFGSCEIKIDGDQVSEKTKEI